MEVGARRLTMRTAARAACLSLGGLYHYFPTKRDLVLHALKPEAFAKICYQFEAESGHLRRTDPSAFLSAFIDFTVSQNVFVRAAVQAALDLGAETFWEMLDAGINAGLDDFTEFLRGFVPGADERDLTLIARSFRRAFFAALLDRTMTADELRTVLLALVEGEPLGVSLPKPVRAVQLAAVR
jgi:AcrR family transcriptional regulator